MTNQQIKAIAKRNGMTLAQFTNFLNVYKVAPKMFGGSLAADLQTVAEATK